MTRQFERTYNLKMHGILQNIATIPAIIAAMGTANMAYTTALLSIYE